MQLCSYDCETMFNPEMVDSSVPGVGGKVDVVSGSYRISFLVKDLVY